MSRDRSPVEPPPDETQRLLEAWNEGRSEGSQVLFDRVYEELRRIAGALMREERADHTLQPTALVHEAYVALSSRRAFRVESRAHFLSTAARAMRRLLVDHARHRRAERAGRVSVADPDLLGSEEPGADALTVHLLLERLQALDLRQAQVVELRYFGGLTSEEIAAVLDLSVPTVTREWRAARVWFRHQLTLDPPTDEGAAPGVATGGASVAR